MAGRLGAESVEAGAMATGILKDGGPIGGPESLRLGDGTLSDGTASEGMLSDGSPLVGAEMLSGRRKGRSWNPNRR